MLEGPPSLPHRRAHLLQGGHQPEHHHPGLAPEDQACVRAEHGAGGGLQGRVG